MILMYHKVFLEAPTLWWVTVDDFYRQMCELQGRKVVYLDDYDPTDPDQAVITFDGIYRNVVQYALPILKRFGYPFECFVTSDYIGGDNAFDGPEPPAEFADRDELRALVAGGGRIQWHGRAHLDLRKVADEAAVARELEPTEEVRALDPRGCRWVAYPYGEFDARTLAAARPRFAGGVSCIQGDGVDPFELNRITAATDTSFARAKISVVVASHEYGRFLVEAIESVLRQTRRPHEILISDDASTDDSAEIGRHYATKHPGLVRFRQNAENLGDHRPLQSRGGRDDRRLRLHPRGRQPHAQRLRRAHGRGPQSRPRGRGRLHRLRVLRAAAAIEHRNVHAGWRGEIKAGAHHLVRFPDFGPDSADELTRRNFIHGSSMFRKRAFEAVGGYRPQGPDPEDWVLFRRMIAAGWGASRVPHPVLEYRQHGRGQRTSRPAPSAPCSSGATRPAPCRPSSTRPGPSSPPDRPSSWPAPAPGIEDDAA